MGNIYERVEGTAGARKRKQIKNKVFVLFAARKVKRDTVKERDKNKVELSKTVFTAPKIENCLVWRN